MALVVNRFFRRRYWPVWLTLVLGLAVSAGLAWGLYRQAEELDRQRFKLEAAHLAALLESTMERYEERLARLADHCARFDELPKSVWYFRSGYLTDLDGNLPNLMHALYCPKVSAAGFPAHAARGRAVWGGRYAFDPEAPAGRDLALPVWQAWSRPGFSPIALGTDMAEETTAHPSLRRGLLHRRGGVSSSPVLVARANGTFENGFWFTLALFKADQGPILRDQGRNEILEEFQRRQSAFIQSVATGILAVFISTDRMVDRSYNDPKTPHRLHVRLYANREPRPESLLNPVSQPPVNPRHREVMHQSWYGQPWTLEMTSTTFFEADSPRYRAWLVLVAGTGCTLLAAGLVGVALGAAGRQEGLTDQIREARDALAAAQQERQKFSHDLHDNAVQTLYAIQLGLGHTAQKLADEPAIARHELSTVRGELDGVIAEMRRFITADAPAEKAADLPAVLLASVQRARAGTTAHIELRCDPGASDRLTTGQTVQLANIAREALSNCLRHAQARRVEMALRSENGAVCLEVADDGVGFDPTPSACQGVGLVSMTTRTREIGGTLDLQSGPGQGTRVVVRVPAAPLEHDGDAGDDEG